MNHILQDHISDLQLVQYSVLPLDSTQGFIEIVMLSLEINGSVKINLIILSAADSSIV